MMKITDVLKEKEFTISVEVVPPRNGNNPQEIYDKISEIKEYIDFVSVTKGAGGSLRGGSLPISYFIQEKIGKDVIAHFVCRERTKQEIENDLVDLHEFKINNILALRGDPPAGTVEEWDGDYHYAYLLTQQIKDMNQGKYIPRNKDEEPYRSGIKTDFCVIVAGHPEDPIDKEIEHLRKKVDAGADLIITQMIFTFEEYRDYVEKLRDNGIDLPVIPGIRPLKTLKQAISLENFFGLKVPDELKKLFENDGDPIEYFVDIIKQMKEFGCPGVHFFVLNDIEVIPEIVKRLF